MKRRDARYVVLVCEDVDCLMLVAKELAATGCMVLCARDVEQAAAFVRAGLTRQFVLVLIGQRDVPPADLSAAMAAYLPQWRIECDELDEVTGPAITAARFVN